jgi:hypothetical protein
MIEDSDAIGFGEADACNIQMHADGIARMHQVSSSIIAIELPIDQSMELECICITRLWVAEVWE